MTKEEIDILWQKAMQESIKDGEMFTRYHFAKLVAKKALAQPERHELQAKGEHPAPCARHCEATAFRIVIKNLESKLAQPEQEPVCPECKAVVLYECVACSSNNYPPQRTGEKNA